LVLFALWWHLLCSALLFWIRNNWGVIPGTQEKMLEEPNVQILVSELKACLVGAQGR
jgi:hypothetical protein